MGQGLGFKSLGILGLSVILLIALWIIQGRMKARIQRKIITDSKKKENNMSGFKRTMNRVVMTIDNIGAGVIGSSLASLNP